MAAFVLHRRTLTPGAIPTLAQIQLGEIVLNVTDGKAYMRKGDGSGTDTVVEITGGGGAAEIVVSATEPASPSEGTAWLDTSISLELASLYDLAVANGFVGTVQDYLDSITGPQGPQGPQGDPGIVVSATAPSNPATDTLWLDIS